LPIFFDAKKAFLKLNGEEIIYEVQAILPVEEGIGVGFPGLVDSVHMKVLSTINKYDVCIIRCLLFG